MRLKTVRQHIKKVVKFLRDEVIAQAGTDANMLQESPGPRPRAPIDLAALSTPLCTLESRKQFVRATRKNTPVMLMYFKAVDGEILVADGDSPEEFHALDVNATEQTSLEYELLGRVPADVCGTST
eukprot:910264-Rhodomonas_salina.1